jgi:hypothetical protein
VKARSLSGLVSPILYLSHRLIRPLLMSAGRASLSCPFLPIRSNGSLFTSTRRAPPPATFSFSPRDRPLTSPSLPAAGRYFFPVPSRLTLTHRERTNTHPPSLSSSRNKHTHSHSKSHSHRERTNTHPDTKTHLDTHTKIKR